MEKASTPINHNPRWQHAYFVLAASRIALGQTEAARAAVRDCRVMLPGITSTAVERVPLKDEAKMQELRTRLLAAGFL